MTAEVVIMNAIGVAMAADSAVTIGNDAKKIFTSSDKLFQLTNGDAVGIMTYGNAVLLGVPWETIIKQYRAFVGKRRLPTVADYASSFLKFVNRNRAMFPMAVQDEHVGLLVRSLFHHFRRDKLKVSLDRELEEKKELTKDEVSRIAEQTLVTFRKEMLGGRHYLPGFDSQSSARILNRHRARARHQLKSVFGTIPLKKSTQNGLVDLALKLLTREVCGPLSSGLVFAGFGEEEYMPEVTACRIECFADRKLRVSRPERTSIEPLGTVASIIPFAQKEVVETFMEGVDRQLRGQFGKQAETALHQVGDALVSAVQKQNPKLANEMQIVLSSGIPRVIQELHRRWDSFTSVHWRPVTEIVSTLPKDELAAMAEALVNLTKFKRRITPQRETVGGPIDVAVITRGDGFVWIKRKHYFEATLNPRVMAKLVAA